MKTTFSTLLIAVLLTLSPRIALKGGGLFIPENNLTFSHALHVGEMEIDCTDCHTSIPGSNSATGRNIPSHKVCAECHEEAIEEHECGTCHRNPEAIEPLPDLGWEIIFSHRKHMSRGPGCVDCHRGVEKAVTLTEKNMPTMEVCTSCHDDRTAPFACSTCHIDPEKIRRMAHPADWRHNHKYDASQNDTSCRMCHTDSDFCLGCHEGDNLRQTSHALNYRYTHMLDAKGKEKDCMVCHTNKGFCNDCHTREEVMPLNHSSAGWPDRDHGLQAARDLEACAACHDEDDPTCLRCHKDSDNIQGTDPSPHGPGFSTERGKGPWHDDPSYLCYRCHVPGRPLTEPGFCQYCHTLRSGGNGLPDLRKGVRNAF